MPKNWPLSCEPNRDSDKFDRLIVLPHLCCSMDYAGPAADWGNEMFEHDGHDDFGGLHRDLRATGEMIDRRGWLRMAAAFSGALGAVHLAGCSGDSPTSPTATTTTPSTTNTTPTTGTTPPSTTTCARVPEETAGPFPGDGSNGPRC